PVIINGHFYLPDEELAQAIGAEVIENTVVYVNLNDLAVFDDLEKQKLSDIEGITNARQLGGYVNTEGRAIKQNVILRTGKPFDATENDLKLLSEKYHVSDMVDFRTDSEVETAPEPTVKGAVNHHIPLNIAGDMSLLVTDEFKQAYVKAMQNGDKGEILLLLVQNNMLPTPEMYAYFLGDEAADGYRQFFNILLNKPEDSAVLFHCTQGKDRTGMGAALFLYALDFDDDTVMSDYLMTNLANTDIIDNDVKAISKYTDDPEMKERAIMMDGVSADLLQSVLDKMNAEYGSVKGYLKTRIGLSDDDLARLKEIYLEPAESSDGNAENTSQAQIADSFYITEITDEIFDRIYGKSFKEDCTVPREDLRYIHVLHKDLDGNEHEGEMIVNKHIAEDVLEIMEHLYEAVYPIEKIRLVDEYNADDEASMEDNNSSSFNFRFISHTTKVSKHGLGLAVDINTLYNPYTKTVDGEKIVEPVNGEPYLDREEDFPYKIDENDLCYKLFIEHGFEWG
ncbi:MAG: tyrosine-protein phosphatase, partial [Firmicutes bacterium]|nr:tyrosine-protein phosphatase [Bacillota bacterium]